MVPAAHVRGGSPSGGKALTGIRCTSKPGATVARDLGTCLGATRAAVLAASELLVTIECKLGVAQLAAEYFQSVSWPNDGFAMCGLCPTEVLQPIT